MTLQPWVEIGLLSKLACLVSRSDVTPLNLATKCGTKKVEKASLQTPAQA